MDAEQFSYSFFVYPDETWKLDPAMYKLFKMAPMRIENTFTEAEFERFRSGLSHHGLTLREIERVPHVQPEHV